MDLNHIALWMAGLPAATLFWRSARAPHRPVGWMVVPALVLFTALVGWFWFQEYAGYLTGVLALLFIMLPIWLHNAGGRASARFQYGRARRLFSLAALLHPMDNWGTTPRMIHAFELAHAGRTDDADALLLLLAREKGDVATLANAQRLRILGRFRELKALGESSGLAVLGREPALLGLYLRALGELGEVQALAEFMRAQERTLIGTGILDMALLYLFAFTGRVDLTRQALSGRRQLYTEETRDFWLAVASKHAGDPEGARRAFSRLRQSGDAQIRDRAEGHFNRLTLAAPEEAPSARTLEIVTYFAQALEQRQNLIPNSSSHRPERRLTGLLIVANTLVYVSGSYPLLIDTHARFGDRWAFFAPDIFSGEWWRVLSYLFVHANAIHLLMNMAGLWVLGPFVERAFGRLRFALIYLFAGCTGSAFYLILTWYGWIQPEQLVGASGCIMGLLGATAAVMLRAWLRQRAAIARQIFFRLLLVVGLQVAFDLSTPQVAGLAHALGLLGGFVSGLLLREGVSPKRSVAALG